MPKPSPEKEAYWRKMVARQRKSGHLALNEEDIPEDLRNDPTARRFFKKVKEVLEMEPAKLQVLEHYQEVIVRNDEAGETTMVTADQPPRMIDASAGPSLLAYLTASRFADHLPYYRQEDILSRYGFRIGRSTQWRWMFALGERVLPLVNLMRELTLQSFVLGVDETPVRMLSLAAEGSVKSYPWGAVGDRGHPYDCFYFTVDRARAGPEAFLSGFRGYLQSDAYICYERIALAHEEILKVACWTHARRKFEEVHFTLTNSCNRHRIGPYAYLRDVYERMPAMSESQLEALLPDRWIQEHPEHLIQQRVDEAVQRAERRRRSAGS